MLINRFFTNSMAQQPYHLSIHWWLNEKKFVSLQFKEITMKSNNKLYKYCILTLTIMLLSGCGNKKGVKNGQAPHVNNIAIDDSLRSRLVKFASKPRPKGQFAFYVYDLTADKPVYGCNENKALPVASCLKLLSGVAGLHLLGTQYAYTTSIYVRGNIENGTLHGDVAFKGELDPQLNEPDLAMFVKALKKEGINKMDGRLIVDLLITDPVKSEPHWYPWDLSFSRYGLLYKGAPKIMKGLKTAMHDQGINVTDSQMVLGKVPQGARCLLRYHLPIGFVINRMWKNSSNTQATSLLYTIGHRVRPNMPPTDAGVAYLRKFLRMDLGLKDTALVLHDGCGLCTYNHLSPLALAMILRYGYKDKSIYQMLNRHLSVSGIDGTLRSELNDSKLRGRIHGKTGTLSHPYGISSLAGYCQCGNGHTLAFAIIDSEMSVLDARVLQDHLCRALVGIYH
jgi:D-alanyl-D-alanine carboxypeptidase/D-alanyl-D-alanine-endopeptidase (penicillin-binding protein 4)